MSETWPEQVRCLMPISDGLISARQLCSNSVDTRNIAPGAVTPTEVQTGFNFVELVTVLPTTGNFEGRMVYLTTDDKLYRHDGAAFLLAVDGADITAATISGDRMIANTITAGQIAAGTITGNEILARSITAAEIAVDTITGTEIAAVTITAGNIAANTITATELNVTTLSAITASMGTLTVDATITMGTGGVFRTAASGNRIELTASEDDRINLYTGDSFENNPGKLIGITTGAGATRTLDTQIVGPSTTGDIGSTSIIIRSESNNDSTSPPGILFLHSGGSSQIPVFELRNSMVIRGVDGSVSVPAYSFFNASNMGLSRVGVDQFGISTGGTLRLEVTNTTVIARNGAHFQDAAPASAGTIDAQWFNAGGNVRRLDVVSSALSGKQDVIPLDDFLDTSKIFDLDLIAFRMKDDPDGPIQIGTSAASVGKHLPSMAYKRGRRWDFGQYSRLVIPLIAEVRKLRDRVDVLEAA